MTYIQSYICITYMNAVIIISHEFHIVRNVLTYTKMTDIFSHIHRYLPIVIIKLTIKIFINCHWIVYINNIIPKLLYQHMLLYYYQLLFSTLKLLKNKILF